MWRNDRSPPKFCHWQVQGVTWGTSPNIGFQVAMFVKSNRGVGGVLTLNMLTWHVLHTPRHAPQESRDLMPFQPPSTGFSRRSPLRLRMARGEGWFPCALPSRYRPTLTVALLLLNLKKNRPLNSYRECIIQLSSNALLFQKLFHSFISFHFIHKIWISQKLKI